MKSVEKTIEKYGIIQKGDKIGVACSGGKDSMTLLHYLNSISKEKGFEVIAITVDHGIRETSDNDAEFVVNYCNTMGIKVIKQKVNALKVSQDKNVTIETAARECRFKVFKALLNKGIVNKIALGHHLQDQAETILLNIFRGTGITGASGMDVIRDGVYIRPLLYTTRAEIMAYVNTNEIPYVDDETNTNIEYSRNYIRNMIMPLIRNRWPNADQSIVAFGDLCKLDDEYIYSTLNDTGIVYESDGVVKIPISYFSYPIAVTNRILKKALKSIGVMADIERKHLKIINGLALEGENGNRITLPNKLSCYKEYNYLTITNKRFTPEPKTWKPVKGRIDIPNYGVIEMNMTRKLQLGEYDHLIDYNKVPKDAVWRYRKDGDVFEKFGGGTKSLSDYLIDKKVPARLRTYLPVLASGNEILVVAGIEISEKVKVDDTTKTAWGINAVRFV
ncbi:MAG TPA: tRNA lysidine(34) synthetase TilS [Clostridiales bacterium]|nr:tRNA lysidine(34) synthetase TilS [Clostridiales bacterium]